MERVMVTLSEELLREIDELARLKKQKRSQVVRLALQEWLDRQRQQEFEALLAEGYQAMAKEAETLVSEALPLQVESAEGIWRWDD